MDKFREILENENKMPENCFFMKNNEIILKNDEQFYLIRDIEENSQVYCSINTMNINIFLNDKFISNLEINIDENIETLIKELNGKIPIDSKIKFEGTEITLGKQKMKE